MSSHDFIYRTIGASNHVKDDRAELDFYATDPIAVEKLIEKEDLNKQIWECACGNGHLSQRLINNGYSVFSSDIVQREFPCEIIDFLRADASLYSGKFDIVTNPPYKYAKEFVLKSLEILSEGCKCAMFLKLTFLEGKTRLKELFSKYPPKTVWVFSDRVQCAKNGDFESLKASGGSAVAYAWFIWEKGYQGDTALKFI